MTWNSLFWSHRSSSDFWVQHAVLPHMHSLHQYLKSGNFVVKSRTGDHSKFPITPDCPQFSFSALHVIQHNKSKFKYTSGWPRAVSFQTPLPTCALPVQLEEVVWAANALTLRCSSWWCLYRCACFPRCSEMRNLLSFTGGPVHHKAVGNSARRVAISSPLASPTCCDSLRRGAPGSTASQTFSSKLVWTVLCEYGISLGLNPLPAGVIWHLPWSSYQVVGEPGMYFFFGSSVSRVVQCCIPCKVKKGGVCSFWDVKRCPSCLLCRDLVDTSFQQIGKNSLFYLVCYVVLHRSLFEAFKGLKQYLLETQVAEETPDINIYFSCQSLDISFYFLDTRACGDHLTINGSNLVVIGQPMCIGT